MNNDIKFNKTNNNNQMKNHAIEKYEDPKSTMSSTNFYQSSDDAATSIMLSAYGIGGGKPVIVSNAGTERGYHVSGTFTFKPVLGFTYIIVTDTSNLLSPVLLYIKEDSSSVLALSNRITFSEYGKLFGSNYFESFAINALNLNFTCSNKLDQTRTGTITAGVYSQPFDLISNNLMSSPGIPINSNSYDDTLTIFDDLSVAVPNFNPCPNLTVDDIYTAPDYGVVYTTMISPADALSSFVISTTEVAKLRFRFGNNAIIRILCSNATSCTFNITPGIPALSAAMQVLIPTQPAFEMVNNVCPSGAYFYMKARLDLTTLAVFLTGATTLKCKLMIEVLEPSYHGLMDPFAVVSFSAANSSTVLDFSGYISVIPDSTNYPLLSVSDSGSSLGHYGDSLDLAALFLRKSNMPLVFKHEAKSNLISFMNTFNVEDARASVSDYVPKWASKMGVHLWRNRDNITALGTNVLSGNWLGVAKNVYDIYNRTNTAYASTADKEPTDDGVARACVTCKSIAMSVDPSAVLSLAVSEGKDIIISKEGGLSAVTVQLDGTKVIEPQCLNSMVARELASKYSLTRIVPDTGALLQKIKLTKLAKLNLITQTDALVSGDYRGNCYSTLLFRPEVRLMSPSGPLDTVVCLKASFRNSPVLVSVSQNTLFVLNSDDVLQELTDFVGENNILALNKIHQDLYLISSYTDPDDKVLDVSRPHVLIFEGSRPLLVDSAGYAIDLDKTRDYSSLNIKASRANFNDSMFAGLVGGMSDLDRGGKALERRIRPNLDDDMFTAKKFVPKTMTSDSLNLYFMQSNAAVYGLAVPGSGSIRMSFRDRAVFFVPVIKGANGGTAMVVITKEGLATVNPFSSRFQAVDPIPAEDSIVINIGPFRYVTSSKTPESDIEKYEDLDRYVARFSPESPTTYNIEIFTEKSSSGVFFKSLQDTSWTATLLMYLRGYPNGCYVTGSWMGQFFEEIVAQNLTIKGKAYLAFTSDVMFSELPYVICTSETVDLKPLKASMGNYRPFAPGRMFVDPGDSFNVVFVMEPSQILPGLGALLTNAQQNVNAIDKKSIQALITGNETIGEKSLFIESDSSAFFKLGTVGLTTAKGGPLKTADEKQNVAQLASLRRTSIPSLSTYISTGGLDAFFKKYAIDSNIEVDRNVVGVDRLASTVENLARIAGTGHTAAAAKDAIQLYAYSKLLALVPAMKDQFLRNMALVASKTNNPLEKVALRMADTTFKTYTNYVIDLHADPSIGAVPSQLVKAGLDAVNRIFASFIVKGTTPTPAPQPSTNTIAQRAESRQVVQAPPPPENTRGALVRRQPVVNMRTENDYVDDDGEIFE